MGSAAQALAHDARAIGQSAHLGHREAARQGREAAIGSEPEALGGHVPQAELDALFKTSSLKQAALEGDVEWGKVEAGQSAGLVDDILPAAEVMRRLVAQLEEARQRLARL